MPGALLLHGYTSTPQSLEGLAAALAGAGFDVEVPLLPGHGTTVDDLAARRWADWAAAAEEAWDKLAARHERAVVGGLSMGGTLATWVAAARPDVAGLACVNPIVDPPAESFRELLRGFQVAGAVSIPGPANDVSDPGAREVAYPQWPIAPMLSLFEAQDDLVGRLASVACPVLVVTSRQDHVVPPVSSDILAAGVAGPVERLLLERSFHLATLDCEADLVEATVLDFARRVTFA